jgi:hypothetical protein
MFVYRQNIKTPSASKRRCDRLALRNVHFRGNKQSEKDFDRPKYQAMKIMIREGDIMNPAKTQIFIADTMHEPPGRSSGFDLNLEFKTDEEAQQAFTKLSEAAT